MSRTRGPTPLETSKGGTVGPCAPPAFPSSHPALPSEMAALDSEAVLQERCAVIGLTPAQVTTVQAAGLTTMSRVAFS